jgi:hypothetical protein
VTGLLAALVFFPKPRAKRAGRIKVRPPPLEPVRRPR